MVNTSRINSDRSYSQNSNEWNSAAGSIDRRSHLFISYIFDWIDFVCFNNLAQRRQESPSLATPSWLLLLLLLLLLCLHACKDRRIQTAVEVAGEQMINMTLLKRLRVENWLADNWLYYIHHTVSTVSGSEELAKPDDRLASWLDLLHWS